MYCKIKANLKFQIFGKSKSFSLPITMFRQPFILIAFLILITPKYAHSRPSNTREKNDVNIETVTGPDEYNGDLSPETIRKVQQCDLDASTMELCMRCAKVTKSEIVYPLCCANEDSVKDWCNKYVFFANEDVGL